MGTYPLFFGGLEGNDTVREKSFGMEDWAFVETLLENRLSCVTIL